MRRVAVIAAAALACVAVGAILLGTDGRGAARGSADGRPEAKARRSEPVGAPVRVAWSQPVRGWPSQLTVDGRAVVALSGGRFVSALTTGDGTAVWETEVPGWLNPFLEPAVDARTVLVSAADRFVALDRADGSLRWEAAAGGDARGVALIPDVAEVAADVVADVDASGSTAVTATVGEDGNGVLAGRDVDDGTPRWAVTGTGSLDTHLAADPRTGSVVAVSHRATSATVRAIDAKSGAIRWERSVEPMVATPVVAGDVVVVAAGDGDHPANVRALEVADGRVRWSTRVRASFEPDLVPGVDLDASGEGGGRDAVGEVAVQDRLGTVSLLDLGTGARRWQTDTGVPALGGRALVLPDVVVVRNEGQELVVLDRTGGRVLTRRKVLGGVPEAIARAGNRVLVAWRWTEPGRIEALTIDDAIDTSTSRP